MSDSDPQRLAEEPARQAHELERRSQEVESDIHQTQVNWERKRTDPGVPWAAPAPDNGDDRDDRSPSPQEEGAS
jgi:hypothetical protein